MNEVRVARRWMAAIISSQFMTFSRMNVEVAHGVLDTMNDRVTDAAMAIRSPMWGLRRSLAWRVLVVKARNVAMVTVEPLARVLAMAVNPTSRPCHKRSVTSRAWMDCGAMARDGKGAGRRRDVRIEILQICVSKARTCGVSVAGTGTEPATTCPIMLFVDRVAKGLHRLERWHLRRRDGKLPEPRNGYRLVRARRRWRRTRRQPCARRRCARRDGPCSHCPPLKLRLDIGG